MIMSQRLPRKGITGASDVAALYRKFIGDRMEHQEVLAVLTLNTKLDALALTVLNVGTITQSLCSSAALFREVFTRPGCASMILIHNHPSGYTDPSPEDIDLTVRINQMCELMGNEISLLDHVIVTAGSHYSLAERRQGGF